MISADTNESNEENAEAAHWKEVKRTFLSYLDFISFDLSRKQQRINRVYPHLMVHLPDSTTRKFDDIFNAAQKNQHFFECMLKFERESGGTMPKKEDGGKIHISQMHRNQAVLHSLCREWSSGGNNERSTAFNPLLTELQKLLPVTESNVYKQVNRIFICV